MYAGFALDNNTQYCFMQDGTYKQWMTLKLPGDTKTRFNIENATANTWLAQQLANIVLNDKLDVLWVDGILDSLRVNGTTFGVAKVSLFKQTAAFIKAGGSNAIICGNADASNIVASGLYPYISCVYTETFGLTSYSSTGVAQPKSPADNKAFLQAELVLAKMGGISQIKTWPAGYSYLAPKYTLTLGNQAMLVTASQTFAAAAYLISMEPGHSYLGYSTGYDLCAWLENCGNNPFAQYTITTANYGIPLNDPVWNGYVATRQFVLNGTTKTVTLNLNNNTATIQ
jgi:hypothetical protein